ncbi:hypothetical protein U0C82_09860 [Fulvimarina sp. 2208YS6-2-32]|uniref:Uncharacterized protein n=1 Tax=Fulvimarina uroteuthidis TaxID=3098149 RepID=A0ABU5I283_9HYPH|nr:hypothetical protein [Fulvimarina sp. 2208YS6-2-32]MDY8109445.1 hypothetical protein [Fulvimarina sp. 2208YS6-2-32]
MSMEDDRELMELVSSALKSLSVAQPPKMLVDFKTVRRSEASIARMVSSLSAHRSESSSSDDRDGPGMT